MVLYQGVRVFPFDFALRDVPKEWIRRALAQKMALLVYGGSLDWNVLCTDILILFADSLPRGNLQNFF